MPDTMPTVPQIPNTAPQIPVPSGGNGGAADIKSIMDLISPANVSQPSTVTGTAPLTPVRPPQPRVVQQPQQTVPMTGQAAQVKSAQRVNGIKGILSAVSRVGAAVENRKSQALSMDIQRVMEAQQQISNAQQVLSADPNNANAKKVLENNTGVLNTILQDDKKRKQISKAFDISFVDPTKNDTPEVKAGQHAVQQFNESAKAGMTADNPAEKQVQEQADGISKEQQARAADIQAGGQQQQTSQAQQKTSVPYAQQFLNKQPMTIAPNPQYAEQLKAQQELQKAVLPRVITGIMQQQSQGAKDAAAAERENLRAQTAYNNTIAGIDKTIIEAQARGDIEKARETSQMKLQLQRDRDAFGRQMAGITLREQLRDKLPANKQQAADLAIYKGAEQMSATALKKVGDLETQKTAMGKNLTPSQREFYDQQINIAKAQMMDASNKQKAAGDRLAKSGYQGVASADNGSSSESSKSLVKVGDDESDEPDDDEADDYDSDK